MVDPTLMCNQHLLGEHVELHMLVGAIEKGLTRSVEGLARHGLVDTSQIEPRHEVIVQEMIARGMRHHSPLTYVDVLGLGSVDVEQSLWEMYRRCRQCRQLQREILAQLCTGCLGGPECCVVKHGHDMEGEVTR